MGRWWWSWAGAGVVRQPKAESGLGHVMAHVLVCAQCLLPVVQKKSGGMHKAVTSVLQFTMAAMAIFMEVPIFVASGPLMDSSWP